MGIFKVAGKLAELIKLGKSPKDALSNAGAAIGVIAGLIEVCIQVGWLDARYQPLVAALPMIALPFIGVPIGRDQNLNAPVKIPNEELLNG